MQLLPHKNIYIKYLNTVINICSNKKIRILLQEYPSFPKGPTLRINICTITIGVDGVWKAKYMIVDIDVPESKEFDINI